MAGAEEHAHIDADLGDQDGGDQPIDAGNLHQHGVLGAITPAAMSNNIMRENRGLSPTSRWSDDEKARCFSAVQKVARGPERHFATVN